jgi:hypothetical protein
MMTFTLQEFSLLKNNIPDTQLSSLEFSFLAAKQTNIPYETWTKGMAHT